MGHHHDHSGHHHRTNNRRRLTLTLLLTLAYMVAEAVGGWLSGSLALLADAGHMLSDAAALALSLLAAWIASRPPTPEHSYGYYRAEILAALANGATLVAISVFIFVEAISRLTHPPEVQGGLMLGIAAGGLAVNLLGLAILNAGKSDNLNMHGAWLHLLTDALGSVAAIVAGALVWARGWYLADPIASILIGLLVIYSSWGLLNESISILMERAPRNINIDTVRDVVMGVPGVCQMHDLHIWTITSGMISLSAHVVLAGNHSADDTLRSLRIVLHDRFGIDHITIQIEAEEGGGCESAF